MSEKKCVKKQTKTQKSKQRHKKSKQIRPL